MDDDLFVIPSDNILIGESDGVFVGGDQDLLSESESIVGPPGPEGPPGRDGVDGVDGQSATVTVGETTTTAPGTDAIVTNVGTNLNAVLNFSIPRGATGETGPAGEDGTDGVDGTDGFSPIATVTQTEYGASISITDSNGTTTAQVVNGSQGPEGPEGPQGPQGPTGPQGPQGPTGATGATGATGPAGADGADGADGYSPTATVTQNTGSATITITDKNGTTTATVYDGVTPDTTVTSYSISNTPAHWAGTNNYILKKQLNLVVLTVGSLWLNSVTANTWTSLGSVDNAVIPSSGMNCAGVVFDGNTGNIVGVCNVSLGTTGALQFKCSAGLSGLCGVTFSMSYFI
jgi:hypothetical protein